MIKKIILRNFKRFRRAQISLPSRVVFAGHNNHGKTSLLQAIAAWRFSLDRWVSSGHRKRSIGMVRKDFAPVPLRELDQLWTQKLTRIGVSGKNPNSPRPIEIEIHGSHQGKPWQLTMEFKYVNKDQVYAKPKEEVPEGAKNLDVVYIPSFSGIGIEEPVFAREYQDIFIGQGKSGEVLRNLLLEVYNKNGKEEWEELCSYIKEIFNCELLSPDWHGKAYILCEYRPLGENRPARLDINTAGSGFQQVLLLLAFLYARPGSVLLIDEPDAHLHVRLQGETLSLLSKIADERDAQLIVATHSEVFIDGTEPENIVSFMGENPAPLTDTHETANLQMAMRYLSAMELLQAKHSQNRILFLEGKSDFLIMRAWARALKHPLSKWLDSANAFVYIMDGKKINNAKAVFRPLQLICPKIKGFVVVDPDPKDEKEKEKKKDIVKYEHNDAAPLVLCEWRRYEVENYLINKDAIHRLFTLQKRSLFGPFWEKAEEKLRIYTEGEDLERLMRRMKASEDILPPALEAAAMPLKKANYYRIAEIMRPEEIHQDVKDMLDAIALHLRIDSGI